MSPTPTPPQMQLSHMPVSGTSPASGFRLSCMQLTDPFEVFVVKAAHVAPATVPKRSSFPSRLPKDWSTGRPATAGIATSPKRRLVGGRGIRHGVGLRRMGSQGGVRLERVEPNRPGDGPQGEHEHHAENHGCVPVTLEHLAEHHQRRHGQQEDSDAAKKVAESIGVLKGMGADWRRRSRLRWCRIV